MTRQAADADTEAGRLADKEHWRRMKTAAYAIPTLRLVLFPAMDRER